MVNQSLHWYGKFTWVCSSKYSIPKFIGDKWGCSLHSTQIHPRSKAWWQRMKHFLVWVIQINCNMPVCEETNLAVTCSAFHNRTQGSICLLVSNLQLFGNFVIPAKWTKKQVFKCISQNTLPKQNQDAGHILGQHKRELKTFPKKTHNTAKQVKLQLHIIQKQLYLHTMVG